MPKRPTLIIFAGANGSGKTTAAEYLLPKLRINEFVNADEIARGLSPLNPSGQRIESGRLVLKRIDNLLSEKTSFAIETTLSGTTLLARLKKAQAYGYLIEMHYIFSGDIRLNVARIKKRVTQGGHHVPAEDVRRRYWRGLKNLVTHYTKICDKINIYDTLDEGIVVFAFKEKDGFFQGQDKKKLDLFFDRIDEAVRDH